MLEFLQTYWREIVEVVLLLATFLVALCKKKVKIYDSVSDIIIQLLPSVISAAEDNFGSGHGKEKLDFVLTFFKSYLGENFPEIKFSRYEKAIINHVEAILSTPQKKG